MELNANIRSARNLPILSTNEFDPERLTFMEKSFLAQSGAKIVSFLYDGHPLYVQTPPLVCPFGFHHEVKHDHDKLTVVPTEEMITLFNNIDATILDAVEKNSEIWFNKTFKSRALLEELFCATVKWKPNYPPNMSVRFKFENNSSMFGVFDTQKNEIVINQASDLVDLIPRKCMVRFVMVASSVWYIGGRLGFTWDCFNLQIQETPLVSNCHQFMFIDDNNMDDVQESKMEEDEDNMYHPNSGEIQVVIDK
jgi:hypothetical protein